MAKKKGNAAPAAKKKEPDLKELPKKSLKKDKPKRKMVAELHIACPNCHKKIIAREFKEEKSASVAATYKTSCEVEIDHQAELGFE